jgi:hypothetical protein
MSFRPQNCTCAETPATFCHPGSQNREMQPVQAYCIDALATPGFVSYRQRQGRQAATINADLPALRRALRLAQEYGRINTVPMIRMFWRRGGIAVCDRLKGTPADRTSGPCRLDADYRGRWLAVALRRRAYGGPDPAARIDHGPTPALRGRVTHGAPLL